VFTGKNGLAGQIEMGAVRRGDYNQFYLFVLQKGGGIAHDFNHRAILACPIAVPLDDFLQPKMGDRLDDWHVEDPGGHAAADYADVDWGHWGALCVTKTNNRVPLPSRQCVFNLYYYCKILVRKMQPVVRKNTATDGRATRIVFY
jgi:hypothetical protein